MNSKITVKREVVPGIGDAGKYTVVIDGKDVGKLAAYEEITLDLPAGEHTIQVKWFFIKSQVIIFTLEDQIRFVCGENREGNKLGKFYIQQVN